MQCDLKKSPFTHYGMSASEAREPDMARKYEAKSSAKKPSKDKEGLSASFQDATAGAHQPIPRLLRRSWGEPFALAAGLWFRFGFRRLLDFFSAFVFASHA
jgi:hypothetical protein